MSKQATEGSLFSSESMSNPGLGMGQALPMYSSESMSNTGHRRQPVFLEQNKTVGRCIALANNILLVGSPTGGLPVLLMLFRCLLLAVLGY
jgi:hypothetical protein